MEMAEARRKALEFARGLGVEAEVFVSSPGARIEADHPLVSALESARTVKLAAATPTGRKTA